MKAFILGCNEALPSKFTKVYPTQLKPLSFDSGELELDLNDSFFPVRSDQKIMRTETKQAVISTQQLLANYKGELDAESTGLFVASGAFVEHLEKHIGHLLRVFENIKDSETETDKLRNIFRASPPLLALQTLTNSTMSFVAQYTNVKGNNATFGTSSLGGFHALKEACYESMMYGNSALVVAANVGGEYSFMSNSSLRVDTGGWKEGAAVGSVLIGNSQENAIASITACESSSEVTGMGSKQIERNWKTLISDNKSDAIIFSGAFTANENKEDQEYLKDFHPNSLGSFEQVGNLGPVNILHGINKGVELLKQGAQVVDIIDRDIYNRESWVRIEAI